MLEIMCKMDCLIFLDKLDVNFGLGREVVILAVYVFLAVCDVGFNF